MNSITSIRAGRAKQFAEAEVWNERFAKIRMQYIRGLIIESEYQWKRDEVIRMRNGFRRSANARSVMLIGLSVDYLDPAYHGDHCEDFDRDGYCGHMISVTEYNSHYGAQAPYGWDH